MMIYSNTPPAYSFPKKKEEDLEEPLPGPGAYEITVKAQAHLPPFPKSQKLPSPKSIAPGPGSYETPYYIGTGPKPTISQKQDSSLSNGLPGPGYYDAIELNTNRSPVRFSKAKKELPAGTIVPGPGEYDVNAFHEGPKWTFPRTDITDRFRAKESPEAGSQQGAPTSRRKSPSNFLPGPGDYEPPLGMSNSLPGFPVMRERKAPAYIRQTESPGPADYVPKSVKKSEPCYAVGKSPKLPNLPSIVPGPGSYNLRSKFSPQGVTMSPKYRDLDFERRSRLPVRLTQGPGSYSPQRRDMQMARPAIPKSGRDCQAGGPLSASGDFELQPDTHKRDGFTFTKARKFPADRNAVPHYEIPSSIGVIQSYHRPR